MRGGVNRRHVLGALALAGAIGLGGCVTTPSGSANSAVGGGPEGDSVSSDAPPTTYADSATTGGVMIVLSREAGAPTDGITFGLLPVSMNGNEISLAPPEQMQRATVRPPESDTGRFARTFDLPPGTYILAHTDFGKPNLWSGSSSAGASPDYSTAMTLATTPIIMLPFVIGVLAANSERSTTGTAGDAEAFDRGTGGNFRHHFARDGRVVDARAIVFTVTPGTVTYIGDFNAIKTVDAAVRALGYSYQTDFSGVEEPPKLPTSLDVIKRPTEDVTRFYHAT